MADSASWWRPPPSELAAVEARQKEFRERFGDFDAAARALEHFQVGPSADGVYVGIELKVDGKVTRFAMPIDFALQRFVGEIMRSLEAAAARIFPPLSKEKS